MKFDLVQKKTERSEKRLRGTADKVGSLEDVVKNSSKVPRKTFYVVIFIFLHEFVVDCGVKFCERQKCHVFLFLTKHGGHLRKSNGREFQKEPGVYAVQPASPAGAPDGNAEHYEGTADGDSTGQRSRPFPLVGRFLCCSHFWFHCRISKDAKASCTDPFGTTDVHCGIFR